MPATATLPPSTGTTPQGFRFARESDGRYSLFDVEMVEPHIFPLPDGSADVFDLERMRSIFDATVRRLPRGKVIEGHTSRFQGAELPQVGTVTNWRFTPTGRMIADLTELDPSVFRKIQCGHLRGRSVEFEIDPNSGECVAVEGVSLLGRNRQFFDFPELAVRGFSDRDIQQLRSDVESFVMVKPANMMQFRSRYAANREKPADDSTDETGDKTKRQEATGAITLEDVMRGMTDIRGVVDELAAGQSQLRKEVDAMRATAEAAPAVEEDVVEETAAVETPTDETVVEETRQDGETEDEDADNAAAERQRADVVEKYRNRIDALRTTEGLVAPDEAVAEVLEVIADTPEENRDKRFAVLTGGFKRAAVTAVRKPAPVTKSAVPEAVETLLNSYPEGAPRERAKSIYREYTETAAKDRAERSRYGMSGQSAGLGDACFYIRAGMNS